MSWLAKPSSASTDDFLESYVCWREACADVPTAYRRWMNCEPRERGLTFARYCTALDRDAHASSIHSDWAERLTARAVKEPTGPAELVACEAPSILFFPKEST